MSSERHGEIRQTRPFGSLEQEVFRSLGRSWAVLEHRMAEVLRPYGVTPTQYNVLRILRGAGTEGLCRADIRDRMIARVPDVTRLLDRMEAAGLIERERSSEDRRFVTTRITPAGRALLVELDDEVPELHRRQFAALERAELRALIDLLGRLRQSRTVLSQAKRRER